MARGGTRRRPSAGHQRRLAPVSRAFGGDRGLPIDRHYIEGFLTRHAADVAGQVLEIGDDAYTRRFGGDRVARADILELTPVNPHATIRADLAAADHLPDATFDCIICTQTLQFIYDLSAAAATLHRILRPGGVLLLTVPGISQISRYDMDRWGDYWRFTTASVSRLLGDAFGPAWVAVAAHGNVLVAADFLRGYAAQELAPRALAYHDPDYQLLVIARAVKADEAG